MTKRSEDARGKFVKIDAVGRAGDAQQISHQKFKDEIWSTSMEDREVERPQKRLLNNVRRKG